MFAVPQLFQKTLGLAIRGTQPEQPTSVWMAGIKVALPSRSVDYLRGPAAPLLDTPHPWRF
jgi:hypothetical protein